jgi:hypothetical protein
MKRREAPIRDGARGVAVLELTLSLVFLVPLLMAALSFGYYFYVGSHAEEAARQGLRQAVLINLPCGPGPVCNAALVNVPVTQAAVGSPVCTSGGAAACYMQSDPLNLGGAANTTVTCACATAPVNPTYTITVQVDFAASVGYFRYLMPAGTGGKVRYTARITGN